MTDQQQQPAPAVESEQTIDSAEWAQVFYDRALRKSGHEFSLDWDEAARIIEEIAAAERAPLEARIHELEIEVNGTRAKRAQTEGGERDE